MSFQAYLDSIKARTGKTPDDFRRLAEKKGLLKPGVKTQQIVDWLKEDFGLQRGHAMAIVLTLKNATQPRPSRDESIERHFRGARAKWRAPYKTLLAQLSTFGADVSEGPTGSYISMLRQGKKFAIVQVTEDRMDVGIRLKGERPTGRFEPAAGWNSMVTHRVRITAPAEIDDEVLGRLRLAFERA